METSSWPSSLLDNINQRRFRHRVMSQPSAQGLSLPTYRERRVVTFMENHKGWKQEYDHWYHRSACDCIDKDYFMLGTPQELYQTMMDVTSHCYQASLEDVIREGPIACNYRYRELGFRSTVCVGVRAHDKPNFSSVLVLPSVTHQCLEKKSK